MLIEGVNSTWSKQGRVQGVGSIGRCNDFDLGMIEVLRGRGALEKHRDVDMQ